MSTRNPSSPTRRTERPPTDIAAPGIVTGAVGTHNVPEATRALSALIDPDYADHFACHTDETATAEQWARAMFGDVPSRAERFIWRRLLGLRLSTGRSTETVAGWRVAARGADGVRLEASSRLLRAELVVQAAEGWVSLTTLIQYDGRVGRYVWAALSPVHRRLAPGLLRDATSRIDTYR